MIIDNLKNVFHELILLPVPGKRRMLQDRQVLSYGVRVALSCVRCMCGSFPAGQTGVCWRHACGSVLQDRQMSVWGVCVAVSCKKTGTCLHAVCMWKCPTGQTGVFLWCTRGSVLQGQAGACTLQTPGSVLLDNQLS
jgi:hypothetical protein